MRLSNSIYTKLRSIGGTRLNAQLSKIVYDLGVAPSVNHHASVCKYPGGYKAGMCISADFEMAWAFRYSKRKVDPIKMAALEREHVPLMLSMFERYDIPITWATVGHLFLESCNNGDHDWMRRIPHFDDHWRFMQGDWYDHDPYSTVSKDNAWYAPDLIEQILKSKVVHEIGCHTFSHMDCTYKNCPPEVLDDELKACKEAAAKWGLMMTSFVFPGGTYGNFEVLKKHGFTIYRKGMDFRLSTPLMDDYGIYVTASTSSFGKGADWHSDYYIHRYCKMIDKAIKSGTVAHFWLHPSVDRWTLDNVMPAVMHYAAQKREAGELWIGTMKDMADFLNRDVR